MIKLCNEKAVGYQIQDISMLKIKYMYVHCNTVLIDTSFSSYVHYHKIEINVYTENMHHTDQVQSTLKLRCVISMTL